MQCTFEEYFRALKGKRVAVLGLGISNRPLVRLLLEFGAIVLGGDRTPRDRLDQEVLELEKMGCQLFLGENFYREMTAQIAFRTPGMHPDSPAVCHLRNHGAEITSEMAAFFKVCPCQIVAVTGSDGKTTTTTLICEMLKAAGKKVWLGGNIGTPLLPLVGQMKPDDVAVVELSSFQLMDMSQSPNRAVITNLAPNHLDVHKDMDEYINAKKNIFTHQNAEGLLILNGDNQLTSAMKGMGTTHYFSRKGEKAYICLSNEGVILRNGQPVLDQKDILLPGVHNVENYMAAIGAVEGLVEDEDIRKVAREFGGVEHRIELVRIKDGVRFYNDSIASSPSRTIAGLRSFPEKVRLIAGGYDKHIPYDVLGPEICAHVKKLYLCGATAPLIRQAVENCEMEKPEILDCGDFDTAVLTAAREAEKGDVVLMSPASASFDCFKNFMVRGDHFKKLIKEL